PNTLYHYRVQSKDAAGNAAVSADFTFTTAAAPDTTPPVISAVSSAGINILGATITWTTDEPSDSRVEYGTTTAYGSSTTLDPSLAPAHSQALTGLSPNTLYHYRAHSRDAAGNAAVSSDFTFTTASATQGMVAAYGFSESAGSTTTDSSGNNNTGTLLGPAARIPEAKNANRTPFNGPNPPVRKPESPS